MSFQPTIRMLINQQELDKVNVVLGFVNDPIDLDAVQTYQQARLGLWRTMDITDPANLGFKATLVEHLATRERVHDYQAAITGRFIADVDGEPTACFTLSTGDIVAAKIYRV